MPSEEFTILYCKSAELKGGKTVQHDKVYIAYLHDLTAGRWSVDYAYGRRGASFKSDTKTPIPVAYGTAMRVYGALIADKTSPGRGANKYERRTGKQFADEDQMRRAFAALWESQPKPLKTVSIADVLRVKEASLTKPFPPVKTERKPDVRAFAGSADAEIRAQRKIEDVPVELVFEMRRTYIAEA